MQLTDAIHSPPRPGQVLLQRRHSPKYLDWLEEEGGPQRRLPSPGSVPSVEREARRGAHTRVIKVRLTGGLFFFPSLLRDDSEHEFATKTSTHVCELK